MERKVLIGIVLLLCSNLFWSDYHLFSLNFSLDSFEEKLCFLSNQRQWHYISPLYKEQQQECLEEGELRASSSEKKMKLAATEVAKYGRE